MSSLNDLISGFAKRSEGLNSAFAAFEAWGFDRAVFADFSPENGQGALRGASNAYPLDWARLYAAKDLGRIDPVLRASRNAVTPLDWSTLETSAAAKRFFATARGHGVGKHGITVPVHAPRGGLAVLSLSADCSGSEWKRLLQRRTADSVLVACHLLALSAERSADEPPKLSSRETECLRWCAAGKTILDIAEILGLSERTVRFHLENARRKLDAVNTRHAAAKALQSGLIAFG